MSHEFEFSAVPAEQVIKIKTKEGMQKYRMVEMSGEERDDYLDQMRDRFEITDDGKVGAIGSFKGHQTDLINRCIRTDEGGKVAAGTVEGWPASTQQGLFDLAQKINGLDKKAAQKAKND